MLEQLASCLESLPGLLDIASSQSELLFRRFELLPKLRLLYLKHVKRYRPRIGKVLLDDLLPQTEDVVDFLLAADDLPLSVADQPLELLDQPGFQLDHPLGVDLDLRFVVAGYEVLDAVDRQVGKRAVLFLVPPRADEVVELGAMSPSAFGEDQPPPAETTVDGALEVVAVLRRPISRQPVRGEHLLDPLEEFAWNELGVIAFILHTPEANPPDVVGVLEQIVKRREVDPARRAF